MTVVWWQVEGRTGKALVTATYRSAKNPIETGFKERKRKKRTPDELEAALDGTHTPSQSDAATANLFACLFVTGLEISEMECQLEDGTVIELGDMTGRPLLTVVDVEVKPEDVTIEKPAPKPAASSSSSSKSSTSSTSYSRRAPPK